MSPKRVIDLLHKEIRGLHEAAYLLAFFTLGSQLFALIRDRLLAHQFGASETLDIFYAAFRIPDTMYALLASMVSLFVLIPFLETAQKEGPESLKRFLSNIFSFFSFALIVAGGIAWFFAPHIIELLYKGFTPEMQKELVSVVRILLFQPFLLGISNLCAAYVQIRGRFLLYAIAPILYNVGIIIGILFIYPFAGIQGLAFGVVLGALMHLGIQWPYMVTNSMTPRFVTPDWKVVFEVVRISIPRTITLSTQQIVILIMVSLASLYAVGSVSSFSFAWNLQSVPLSIIGVSYSVAAFPKLARLFGNGELDEYKKLILVAIRQIVFWALPSIVFIVVLRAQIVRVVLGTGEFDWGATKMTAAILALLVASLVAQSIVVLLVRACYAAGKTFVPLSINVLSALLTIGTTFLLLHLSRVGAINTALFSKFMRVEETQSPEILLIALAYSVGSVLNAFILIGYFELRYGVFLKGVSRTFWQSLVASLVAGFGTYLALNLLDDIVSKHTLVGILLQGALAGIVGVWYWVVTLVTLDNKDIVAAWLAFQTKLSAARVRRVRGPIEGM